MEKKTPRVPPEDWAQTLGPPVAVCSANEVSDYSVLTWYETKTGITEDEVKEAILKERNDNLDAMGNG